MSKKFRIAKFANIVYISITCGNLHYGTLTPEVAQLSARNAYKSTVNGKFENFFRLKFSQTLELPIKISLAALILTCFYCSIQNDSTRGMEMSSLFNVCEQESDPYYG